MSNNPYEHGLDKCAANHVPLLSHMIGKLQDADFVAAVRDADDPAVVVDLMEQAFAGL